MYTYVFNKTKRPADIERDVCAQSHIQNLLRRSLRRWQRWSSLSQFRRRKLLECIEATESIRTDSVDVLYYWSRWVALVASAKTASKAQAIAEGHKRLRDSFEAWRDITSAPIHLLSSPLAMALDF